MMNLNMTLEMSSNGVLITCPAFGFYQESLAFSTTRHVVLDICQIKFNTHHTQSFFSNEEETHAQSNAQVFH